MPRIQQERLAVVGAGLTGSLMSLYLAQLGFDRVDVYEKRRDCREQGSERSRRTIAMSISTRGWGALEIAGLYDDLYPTTTATHGRVTHLRDGPPLTQNYGREQQAIYTITRSTLNAALIDKAATGGVRFHFEHTLRDIDLTNKTITLVDARGQGIRQYYDRLIGADGVFSTVCRILEQRGVLAARRDQLELGYKELIVPYRPGPPRALDTRHIHVWPTPQSILVALPSDQDRRFTANLFAPLVQSTALEARPRRELHALFQQTYPTLWRHAPDLTEQYLDSPIAKIFTVDCDRWSYRDHVLLLGDAAHAIAPFYAMGMNLCFEDCIKLRELIDRHDLDLGQAIAAFECTRKPDTDAMAQLTMENFETLRRSGSPAERTLWARERERWERDPEHGTPEYVSVAFTTRPLREILRERRQRRATARRDGSKI
ncbi:MAG: NAD(P)/FAD-dependent oxidoreductase [Myxococcota bacterium]